MAELHQINANDGQAYGDMAQDGLMPAVLRVKDFFFTYAEVNAEAKRPALRGVDFTLQSGQVTLLLGKSGGGGGGPWGLYFFFSCGVLFVFFWPGGVAQPRLCCGT